ncbi:MAG TPA: hypothetical protein VFY87_26875, partial [Geminicoccaceae bacterium]|nr:hypothetical protein [Geminicoccaceae bacterium]
MEVRVDGEAVVQRSVVQANGHLRAVAPAVLVPPTIGIDDRELAPFEDPSNKAREHHRATPSALD